MARTSAPRPTDAAPSRWRRLFRVAEVALWVLVVALFAWRVVPQVRAAAGWGGAGTPAPAVTFDLLDGGPLPLKALRGQVVLVNFWATWCPPCRAEMPGFESVYSAKRAEGFTVVGVSMDEGTRLEIAAFLKEHAITYPVATATPDLVAAFGGVSEFPTSFLIDKRGRLRYTVHGIFASPALRAAITRLLAEPS
jgi:cytochrome c biogenesis protein CcmG, thiol:disulfide interchange protein DsbE